MLKKRITQNQESIRVLNSATESISPRSGWSIFIDDFLSLGIITLPDFSGLASYDIPMDGLFITVEVTTLTNYRIYSYGIPYESTSIKEVSNIMRIMKLIENEFGIPSLDKYYFQ